MWAILGALFFSKAILAKLMYREGADGVDVLTLRMIFALPFFIMIGLWARRSQPYQMTRNDYVQKVCVWWVSLVITLPACLIFGLAVHHGRLGTFDFVPHTLHGVDYFQILFKEKH